MISFVVPAHNEEAYLGRTLQAIHESTRATGQPYEIIVVDDASTDATPDIARQHNARVVSVKHRQIAATRNSGGRAAQGDRIFFVDADTTANPKAVASALRYMDQGAVGGGAPTWFDDEDKVPDFIRPFGFLVVLLTKVIGFTGGAFMFSTRAAFQATGGFNERLYWSEEGSFALRLKREGRFVVLWDRVITSARRFRTLSGMKGIRSFARMLSSPFNMFTRRESVQNIWYDSNRADDQKPVTSIAEKLINRVILLLLLVAITEPIWCYIPWSYTPITTPLGKARYAVGTTLCHVGLVFWIVVGILLVNLLRQKRCTSLIHSTALIAFFSWQAWGASHGVIRFWSNVGDWVGQLWS